MMARSLPVWLPAVATSIALRASRSRPVWKKIPVPSDAKAGEKAFALVARTAWMALTWSSTCSMGRLGESAGVAARGRAGGARRGGGRDDLASHCGGLGDAHDLDPQFYFRRVRSRIVPCRCGGRDPGRH